MPNFICNYCVDECPFTCVSHGVLYLCFFRPTRVTKKKLKINPNRPAGKRFVFDEEGNAVPPLAAFAKQIASNKEGNIAGALYSLSLFFSLC